MHETSVGPMRLVFRDTLKRGGGTISLWLVVTPPPPTTYQQEHPFCCKNQQNQKITFQDKFSNCFSFHNISHTKIGFYTLVQKKKKKKRRKRLRHCYLKPSLWLFNLNFVKEISQLLLLPPIIRILKGCFLRTKGDDFVVHANITIFRRFNHDLKLKTKEDLTMI